ncbi:Ankyrin repeat protein 1 [Giardia muris]|uniref:Ankyrin repeat protein 1 n=1 Tax=Giardia muris TaxID=5742 RepID=A0A4Z1T5S6_GIAMU|nr:Ankyrin repeat protein 1 [Giardia muris]|eukprot:TNJ28487.1 Ankyrin repeat protein 1 [Giardia muris]
MGGYDKLSAAATIGNVEYIQGRKSIAREQRDPESWTPLMFAAYFNQLEAVEELIEAFSGMQTQRGSTALMLAIFNGARDCALRLAEVESERGKQNARGETALMLAVTLEMLDVAAKLMPYERDIIDSDGRDVLQFSNADTHEEVTRLYADLKPANSLSILSFSPPSLDASQISTEHSSEFPASVDTSATSSSLKYIVDLLNGRIGTFRELERSGQSLDPSICDSDGRSIEDIAKEMMAVCKDEAISSKKNIATLVLRLCDLHRQKEPKKYEESDLSSLIKKI